MKGKKYTEEVAEQGVGRDKVESAGLLEIVALMPAG